MNLLQTLLEIAARRQGGGAERGPTEPGWPVFDSRNHMHVCAHEGGGSLGERDEEAQFQAIPPAGLHGRLEG